MYDPLPCYPPYTTVGLDAARFFLRLAARTSTVLLPPNTYVGADSARFLFGRRVERPFTVLLPYTTPKLNAACFGATSVGVLGDPSLCYFPTLHLS